MRTHTGLWIAAALAVGAIGGSVLAQTARTLSLDSKPVSNSVIEQNGTAYVPVSDVAKLLNRSAIKRADGNYDLVATEGQAKPVPVPSPKAIVPEKKPSGLSGEIGDALTNGQVVLTVASIERGTEYVSALTQKTYKADAGSEYVIVKCTLKNALKRARQFDIGYFKGGKTVLVDLLDKQIAPKEWDRSQPIAMLAPGATCEFAVLFAVSNETALEEFVYEVRPNDFDRTMRFDTFRVRIPLAKSIP